MWYIIRGRLLQHRPKKHGREAIKTRVSKKFEIFSDFMEHFRQKGAVIKVKTILFIHFVSLTDFAEDEISICK